MIRKQGPFPTPSFVKQMAANVVMPMTYSYSGEFTASIGGLPMGACLSSGKVSGVWLSVEASGKDDSETLSFAGDASINGTSCLTTSPVIAHVSGESSQQKTTVKTGDTGITAGVVDQDNNTFSQGDVVTVDLTLTRTASPTTEMKHPCIVVEFDPS